jgi:hypothetical protein
MAVAQGRLRAPVDGDLSAVALIRSLEESPMKFSFLRATALAAAVLAVLAACAITTMDKDLPPEPAPSPTPAPPQPPIDPVVDDCNVTLPSAPITSALLTSGLPCQPQFVPPFDLDGLQHGFDYYSWLTFIALNASTPNAAPLPQNDAPLLWQSYAEISDILLPGGKTPAPWGSPRVIPDVCKSIPGAANLRVLRKSSLAKTLTGEVIEPFDTGPLIDQNGNYVRYEILVNQPMFEYIVQNGLYSVAGQAAFTTPVAFPEAKNDTDANGNDLPTGTVGAIMVKAAWKVIGANDDPSRFHIVHGLAYNPPSENPKIAESCSKVTLGLVGWHAAHKTADAPQWIWSTFEHVDNVPSDADIVARKLAAHYNFYRPGCSAADCPVNQPPPRPWNPDVQPFPGDYRSQITRVIPLTDETIELNDGFQAILAGTVWNNYELISTQWPTDATSKVDPTGVPAPVFLANTTLETYIQGMVPQASSSCMDCHNNAAATSGRESDFTFILERAQ